MECIMESHSSSVKLILIWRKSYSVGLFLIMNVYIVITDLRRPRHLNWVLEFVWNHENWHHSTPVFYRNKFKFNIKWWSKGIFLYILYQWKQIVYYWIVITKSSARMNIKLGCWICFPEAQDDETRYDNANICRKSITASQLTSIPFNFKKFLTWVSSQIKHSRHVTLQKQKH